MEKSQKSSKKHFLQKAFEKVRRGSTSPGSASHSSSWITPSKSTSILHSPSEGSLAEAAARDLASCIPPLSLSRTLSSSSAHLHLGGEGDDPYGYTSTPPPPLLSPSPQQPRAGLAIFEDLTPRSNRTASEGITPLQMASSSSASRLLPSPPKLAAEGVAEPPSPSGSKWALNVKTGSPWKVTRSTAKRTTSSSSSSSSGATTVNNSHNSNPHKGPGTPKGRASQEAGGAVKAPRPGSPVPPRSSSGRFGRSNSNSRSGESGGSETGGGGGGSSAPGSSRQQRSSGYRTLPARLGGLRGAAAHFGEEESSGRPLLSDGETAPSYGTGRLDHDGLDKKGSGRARKSLAAVINRPPWGSRIGTTSGPASRESSPLRATGQPGQRPQGKGLLGTRRSKGDSKTVDAKPAAKKGPGVAVEPASKLTVVTDVSSPTTSTLESHSLGSVFDEGLDNQGPVPTTVKQGSGGICVPSPPASPKVSPLSSQAGGDSIQSWLDQSTAAHASNSPSSDTSNGLKQQPFSPSAPKRTEATAARAAEASSPLQTAEMGEREVAEKGIKEDAPSSEAAEAASTAPSGALEAEANGGDDSAGAKRAGHRNRRMRSRVSFGSTSEYNNLCFGFDEVPTTAAPEGPNNNKDVAVTQAVFTFGENDGVTVASAISTATAGVATAAEVVANSTTENGYGMPSEKAPPVVDSEIPPSSASAPRPASTAASPSPRPPSPPPLGLEETEEKKAGSPPGGESHFAKKATYREVRRKRLSFGTTEEYNTMLAKSSNPTGFFLTYETVSLKYSTDGPGTFPSEGGGGKIRRASSQGAISDYATALGMSKRSSGSFRGSFSWNDGAANMARNFGGKDDDDGAFLGDVDVICEEGEDESLRSSTDDLFVSYGESEPKEKEGLRHRTTMRPLRFSPLLDVAAPLSPLVEGEVASSKQELSAAEEVHIIMSPLWAPPGENRFPDPDPTAPAPSLQGAVEGTEPGVKPTEKGEGAEQREERIESKGDLRRGPEGMAGEALVVDTVVHPPRAAGSDAGAEEVRNAKEKEEGQMHRDLYSKSLTRVQGARLRAVVDEWERGVPSPVSSEFVPPEDRMGGEAGLTTPGRDGADVVNVDANCGAKVPPDVREGTSVWGGAVADGLAHTVPGSSVAEDPVYVAEGECTKCREMEERAALLCAEALRKEELLRAENVRLHKRLAKADAKVAERDAMVAMLRAELADRDARVAIAAGPGTDLAAREERLAQVAWSLLTGTSETEALLSSLREQLAQRDSQLATRDAELAIREAELSARDSMLAERDARIAAKDRILIAHNLDVGVTLADDDDDIDTPGGRSRGGHATSASPLPLDVREQQLVREAKKRDVEEAERAHWGALAQELAQKRGVRAQESKERFKELGKTLSAIDRETEASMALRAQLFADTAPFVNPFVDATDGRARFDDDQAAGATHTAAPPLPNAEHEPEPEAGGGDGPECGHEGEVDGPSPLSSVSPRLGGPRRIKGHGTEGGQRASPLSGATLNTSRGADRYAETDALSDAATSPTTAVQREGFDSTGGAQAPEGKVSPEGRAPISWSARLIDSIYGSISSDNNKLGGLTIKLGPSPYSSVRSSLESLGGATEPRSLGLRFSSPDLGCATRARLHHRSGYPLMTPPPTLRLLQDDAFQGLDKARRASASAGHDSSSLPPSDPMVGNGLEDRSGAVGPHVLASPRRGAGAGGNQLEWLQRQQKQMEEIQQKLQERTPTHRNRSNRAFRDSAPSTPRNDAFSPFAPSSAGNHSVVSKSPFDTPMAPVPSPTSSPSPITGDMDHNSPKDAKDGDLPPRPWRQPPHLTTLLQPEEVLGNVSSLHTDSGPDTEHDGGANPPLRPESLHARLLRIPVLEGDAWNRSSPASVLEVAPSFEG